jgi:curli biogenesis system outer membrane secretion channel CsgG
MRLARPPRVGSRVRLLTLALLVSGAAALRAQSIGTVRQVTVVVMPFEFTAPLPAQPRVAPLHRPSMWPPALVRISISPASYPSEAPSKGPDDAIGVGIADLLVERLLEVPGIRVLERRRLDLVMSEQRLPTGDSVVRRDTRGGRMSAAILRARYVITGSVTRFGTEEHRGLGGVGGRFGLGVLGFKRPKTQVTLTARVVDAVTGEVMVSMTGTGTSTKGGSILIGGVGGGVGGGVALTSSEFRASALGEATGRAIEALVAEIVTKRDRLQ